jgi:hypothetical protein
MVAGLQLSKSTTTYSANGIRPVSMEFHQSFMDIKCADVAPY